MMMIHVDCQASIIHTNIGTINKAEEIEHKHGGDDHQVNLESQLGLCLGIKVDERVAISVIS
jgi:hypothetical protein